MKRRQLLMGSAFLSTGVLGPQLHSIPKLAQSPGIIASERMRPTIPYGVASGDVSLGQATIWSRSDRPTRMIVEYALDESFRNPTKIVGPAALELSNYTARINLTDLPAGEQIFYRVTFQDLSDVKVYSEPVTGSLRTIAKAGKDIRFAWSGDTAGQGWGINPDWGGMRIYETIR